MKWYKLENDITQRGITKSGANDYTGGDYIEVDNQKRIIDFKDSTKEEWSYFFSQIEHNGEKIYLLQEDNKEQDKKIEQNYNSIIENAHSTSESINGINKEIENAKLDIEQLKEQLLPIVSKVGAFKVVEFQKMSAQGATNAWNFNGTRNYLYQYPLELFTDLGIKNPELLISTTIIFGDGTFSNARLFTYSTFIVPTKYLNVNIAQNNTNNNFKTEFDNSRIRLYFYDMEDVNEIRLK